MSTTGLLKKGFKCASTRTPKPTQSLLTGSKEKTGGIVDSIFGQVSVSKKGDRRSITDISSVHTVKQVQDD